jgi:alpha-tubulin suppressor-like RCC1 family protein
MMALSATTVSASPIRTQAAGLSGLLDSVWAWGTNGFGQLGNATITTSSSSTPIQVSLPSGTAVTAIAGGSYHSLALTSTGQVLAWGYNMAGALGNGTTTSSSTPVQVSLPSGTTVTAIAGGGYHSLALTSSGQVLAWGYNLYGQLGNGSNTFSSTPVQVSLPSGTTVTAIAGGWNHSLALTSTGQVLAWGLNQYGQLGNGTVTDSNTPVQVSLPSGTTAVAIAAGEGHSVVVTSTGQVLAWGSNQYGQLGNETTIDSSTPVAVSLPSGTTVTAIAAGDYHSLALTSSGQELAWGANFSGQLGNGSTTDSSTPVAVSLPSGTTVTAIAGGGYNSLALTSSGQVLAWGSNSDGQLGNGTVTDSSTPVPVTGLETAATAIAAGSRHSLAIQVSAVAAVFPAMANGAYGGYVTAATIQNTGTAPAIIRIAYFDQNGAPVGAGDSISSLPVNASWTVRQDNGNSFPSSGGDAAQAGSAIVYSSQPIASFVNEFPPGSVGDATSYSGVQVSTGVGTTLYAPTIVNNAYGGYATGIGLLNEGSGATNVTITYREGTGIVVKTQTVYGLAAHAYLALYSGDTVLGLPGGFAGTATITNSADWPVIGAISQPLAAIVNETGPGGQFSSYDAVPAGSTMLNEPVALNNAFGGYYTGMGIQNTSASSGTVTITYYDTSGTATPKSFPIAANGYLGVYQGSATDGPAVGAYTATITGTLPLAAIVNEVATSNTSAMQSTSYSTFSAGSSTLNLPLVENAGSDPWSTGEGIMNTGAVGISVTVTYYDIATGAVLGTPQSHGLAPNAFWGLYQPTGGLPSGARATAVITTSAGGQVAVICNESSSSTFMSYDGQ